MKNYLVRRESDGVVTNVIVWDGVSEYLPIEGHALLPCDEWPHAWIGWKWDGTDFQPPIQSEPVTTVPPDIAAALIAAGWAPPA